MSLMFYVLLIPQKTLQNFHIYLSKDTHVPLKYTVGISGETSIENDIHGNKTNKQTQKYKDLIQEVKYIQLW